MSKPKSPFDIAIAYARDLGAREGHGAAGWFEMDTFGGHVTRGASEAARRVIAGIENGDPTVLNALPTADLSGQWADRMTGPGLVADALDEAGLNEGTNPTAYRKAADNWFTSICDAYETAFDLAVQDEVLRTAKLTIA